MYPDPISLFFCFFLSSFELRFYGPVNLLVSFRVGLVAILALFLGRLNLSEVNWSLNTYFCQLLTLPFLNLGKGENGHRNGLMINIHRSYVAKLGFKLAKPDSAVRHAMTALWNLLLLSLISKSNLEKSFM